MIPSNVSICLIVTGWEPSPRPEGSLADGYDFIRKYGVRIPDTLTAVTSSAVIRVSEPNLWSMHRRNKGWRWGSNTPELFPRPPFLLTDDDEFDSSFSGPVGVRLTTETDDCVVGECDLVGEFLWPVFGDGWVGVVRIEEDRRDVAELTA